MCQVYIILDLMRGGMLLDALLNCEDNRYTEKDARRIFMQLLEGLSYLHERYLQKACFLSWEIDPHHIQITIPTQCLTSHRK